MSDAEIQTGSSSSERQNLTRSKNDSTCNVSQSVKSFRRQKSLSWSS